MSDDITVSAWFKETSLETSQWIWGTLQGAFNEKQTIGQILTDAGISMIPMVGDITAIRDLTAVSMGLIQDPKKRESVSEWVFLVILLFALIPVMGGVIKGVGRLAVTVTPDVARNSEILQKVIHYLNRVGEGNAPKWLKALDLQTYQAELLDRLHVFCDTQIMMINKIMASSLGRALPERWHGQLRAVAEGYAVLRNMGFRMIPPALKELNAKLKVLQALVYRGEFHTIMVGSGHPVVRYEAEAYLIERPLREAPKQGTRFPSIHAESSYKNILWRKYYKYGYPDLLGYTGISPAFGSKEIFTNIASFSGEITAKSARDMAGSTIFRAFGNETKLAQNQGGSWAAGGFWGYQKIPGDAREWRQLSAVLDEWNGNGFLVVLHLPQDLAARMPGTNAWHGKIAEQFGVKQPQYLEGGGEQVIINLDESLKKELNRIGEQVKITGQPASVEINGVKAEFYPSGWKEVEGVHGYNKPEGIEPPYATITRKLHDDELRNKVTGRTIINATRLEHQTSTGNESVTGDK